MDIHSDLRMLYQGKGVAMKEKRYFVRHLVSDSSETIQEKCLGLLCIAAAVLMFVRCFFGVEFTDEAYCISDALAIMHGNIPYAYSTSLIAGQSFVPMLFYKVYELFVPDLEGIFLYSRLCYVLFRLAVLLAVYHLLRYDLARKWRLLILLAMIPFMGSIIQNFSYNTVAAHCTLLVAVLLYTAQRDSGKTLYCKMAAAGILSAISVFAHPVSAIAVIVNLVLLLAYRSQKNWFRALLTYCFGGIAVIFAVFVPIIWSAGMDKLIYGLDTMLHYRSSVANGSTKPKIIWILEMGAPYFLCLFLSMGCLSILFFKTLQIRKENSRLLALGISLCAALTDAWIIMRNINFLYVAGMLLFAACVIAILMCDMRHSLTWFFLLPNVLYVAFLVLFTQTGAPRFYYCIPLVLLILFTMFRSDSHAVKATAAVLAVLFSVMQGYIDFTFVYRDSPLTQLNTRVEQGVYKGMYTTPEWARDVVELEIFLDANIAPTERVSFRDNAPVAYLMQNKNVCDVRTWDEMQYSYGSDDPSSMYRYYQNTESVPDVIAYVDFGRDPVMSIDNTSATFQYNDFVNRYYDLEEATLENRTFRVKLYRNNGEFAEDFDALLQWTE